MSYRALFLVMIGLFVFSSVYADVPKLTNFQGRLIDASGKFALDGNYSMTFSIYTDSTGGSAKWSETQSVAISKGLFNVILGLETPIPDSIFNYSNTWLGIQVASDPEMSPRQHITSSGYSYKSLKADTASYAKAAINDGDWTISGNNIYRLNGNVGIATTSPNSLLEIAKDNSKPSLLLRHPDSTDPDWDNSPLSALKVQAPLTPTTRNFVSGIWVETNGAAVDKGRGVFVHNLGKSDGICIQQDGSNGTGLAILTTNRSPYATGAVIGTALDNQQALVLRQETSLYPTAKSSTLLALEANGSLTEMMRVNSTIPSQVGIMARMSGENSLPFVVQDSSAGMWTNVITLSNKGGAYFAGNLGIGTWNSTNILTVVQGSATDPIADAWTTYSSREYKRDIRELTPQEYRDALEKLLSVPVVKFHYKGEDSKEKIGVIAEEAPKEILSEGNNKAISLNEYISLLHAALRAQQDEIQALKIKLEQLESKR